MSCISAWEERADTCYEEKQFDCGQVALSHDGSVTDDVICECGNLGTSRVFFVLMSTISFAISGPFEREGRLLL